jgi:hypothetical protein
MPGGAQLQRAFFLPLESLDASHKSRFSGMRIARREALAEGQYQAAQARFCYEALAQDDQVALTSLPIAKREPSSQGGMSST